jgi:hypothetical protein
MSRIIHARLDPESAAILDQLQRRCGWSDSQIVREGIKALSLLLVPRGKRRIVGMGQFASRITDLGSNKKHLKGFGR